MKAFDAFAVGVVALAILAVVLSKGSRDSHAISSGASGSAFLFLAAFVALRLTGSGFGLLESGLWTHAAVRR
jgi:hypothetical protein